MRKPICFIVIFLLVFLRTVSVGHAEVLAPDLESLLTSLAPGDEIPVIITLSDQININSFEEKDKDLLRSKIVEALKRKADLSQGPLKTFLENGGIKKLIQLWIINGIAVTLPAWIVSELALFQGIDHVSLDHIVQGPPLIPADAPLPEWNIAAVKAPDLWSIGHDGSTIVVANLDTGVDINHADLSGRWRGGPGTTSWFNPYATNCTPIPSVVACAPCDLSASTPCDAKGHGTATMGVMVGGSAGGTAIGVAPGAKWIAAKIFADPIAGNPPQALISAIHQAFQWLLAPEGNPANAPDVVNASWGFNNVNGCDLTFQPDIQTLRAAGIAVVFAGGNSGPNPSTSESPPNNPGAFPVGAIQQSLTIASFSSRGPSACDESIYPHVVAPGVNIRTSDLTQGGLFPNSYVNVSGSSFAAPHVAGTMALLLGAFPGLAVSYLEAIVRQSAVDLGPPGPDNTYGDGLVDGLGAHQQVVLGQAIRDLITHYYNSIFGRAPDQGGFDFWVAEMERLALLGIDPHERSISLAKIFFNSYEYLLRNRTDAEYAGDLFQTFLQRAPTQPEIDLWVAYITGASRNLALLEFAFSPEFKAYLDGLFGAPSARPENNLVNDFYRGLLQRFPDTGGFNFWLDLMRAAQCAGAQQLRDASYAIAWFFVNSEEYVAMGNGHAQFIEHLYDGILRRSADLDGLNFWIGLLNSGAWTRDQVLQFFTGSPEFQARIQGVLDAGCIL